MREVDAAQRPRVLERLAQHEGLHGRANLGVDETAVAKAAVATAAGEAGCHYARDIHSALRHRGQCKATGCDAQAVHAPQLNLRVVIEYKCVREAPRHAIVA